MRLRSILFSHTILLFFPILCLGFMVGCGPGESPENPEITADSEKALSPSGLEDRVVVYSPHGKEILTDFQQRFEAAYPGTTVEWLYLSSQQCLERVRNEKQNPGADIWWGAGHTTFMAAAEEGLLAPYKPSWAGEVKPDHHDPQDRWYACFLSPEIIFYNHQILSASEAPADWADLADPKYNDRLLVRFPPQSDTMRAILFGMIDRSVKETGSADRAFEWMLQVDANTKEYLSGGEQVFRKMAQRVGSISMWTLSDIMLQRSKYEYPFEIVYPTSGSPVILDGIAKVANCAHPKAAEAYYEFVTSTESAVALANEPYYRISTRNDLPADRLPAWMSDLRYEEQDLDWDLYVKNMADWMKRWTEQVNGQGDAHRESGS
jgi:iron(III) transport system substrate-binding protein